MTRKKHSKKEIEKAVQYAEQKGWEYKKVGKSSHAWGRLFCPLKDREGCSMSIWSTPKNIERHAKQIRRRVDMCPHDEKANSHEKK